MNKNMKLKQLLNEDNPRINEESMNKDTFNKMHYFIVHTKKKESEQWEDSLYSIINYLTTKGFTMKEILAYVQKRVKTLV